MIWRQHPKVGERRRIFGARSPSPRTASLFLTRASERFTPVRRRAQDPPMTLVGNGAGHIHGRPRARHGHRQIRRGQAAIAAALLDARPPQPARPRLRSRRAAVGNRDGPEGRRRAQPDPAGPATTAGRSRPNGSNYDGSAIPDHRHGDGFEPPKVWWNPSISPESAADLHRRSVPAVEGRRA